MDYEYSFLFNSYYSCDFIFLMNIEGLSLMPMPEGWYQIRELRIFRKRKKTVSNFSARGKPGGAEIHQK